MDEEAIVSLSVVIELVSSSDNTRHCTHFTDKKKLIALFHTQKNYIISKELYTLFLRHFLHRNHPSLYFAILVSRDRHIMTTPLCKRHAPHEERSERFGQPLRSVLFNAERSRDLSTSNITAHMIWVPGHTAERQIEYAPCLFQILEHAHCTKSAYLTVVDYWKKKYCWSYRQ